MEYDSTSCADHRGSDACNYYLPFIAERPEQKAHQQSDICGINSKSNYVPTTYKFKILVDAGTVNQIQKQCREGVQLKN